MNVFTYESKQHQKDKRNRIEEKGHWMSDTTVTVPGQVWGSNHCFVLEVKFFLCGLYVIEKLVKLWKSMIVFTLSGTHYQVCFRVGLSWWMAEIQSSQVLPNTFNLCVAELSSANECKAQTRFYYSTRVWHEGTITEVKIQNRRKEEKATEADLRRTGKHRYLWQQSTMQSDARAR